MYRVSVVIPCWNAERFVGRAIQSALDQVGTQVEVLVVDDGSTDRSLDAIKSFGNRVTWRTGPNRGACSARNLGLAETSGQFVLFLDADDYLEGNRYLSSLAEAVSKPEADLAIGPLIIETLDGQRLAQPRDHLGKDNMTLLDGLSRYRMVQTSQVLWRSDFIRQMGGWDESLSRLQDTEIIIRAASRSAKIALSDEGAAVWVQHQSASRISTSHGRRFLHSEYIVLRQLSEALGTSFNTNRLALIEHIYNLAARSYRLQVDDVGDLALAMARELGLIGHLGTARHKWLCNLLGLKRKEQWAGRIREALRQPETPDP